jgi:hypothetical protein
VNRLHVLAPDPDAAHEPLRRCGFERWDFDADSGEFRLAFEATLKPSRSDVPPGRRSSALAREPSATPSQGSTMS